jgi:hypothetical protein
MLKRVDRSMGTANLGDEARAGVDVVLCPERDLKSGGEGCGIGIGFIVTSRPIEYRSSGIVGVGSVGLDFGFGGRVGSGFSGSFLRDSFRHGMTSF